MPGMSMSSPSGAGVKDNAGAAISGAKIEVGSVTGPASYPTGGFTLDLSARFTSLKAVILELISGTDTAGAKRWEVTLDFPGAGQCTIKMKKTQFNQASISNPSVASPPTGVTVQAASGPATSTNAAQASGPGHVVGSNTGSAVGTDHTHSHSHTFDNIFDHGHTVTQTATDTSNAEVPNGSNLTTMTWRYVAIGV
jgi:hypothetical protein